MTDCIFCEIVRGEIPSFKVWEDAKHIAILSIYPNTEGFTVVITKKHYSSYAFANEDVVLSELTMASKKVALLLDATFEDVGRTGLFYEGFGVDHLHAKLFPMHGTADLKKWKPVENPREEYYEKYPGFLSSHDSKRADDEKLKETAKKIIGTDQKINK